MAVIAPAGPAPQERLAVGLGLLAARYRVLQAPGLLSRDGYLAGDDGRRLAELRWALSDPALRAVFCARGGYGLTRILPALCAIRSEDRRRVPVIGFSDVTVLLALQFAARTPCVHGPVLTQVGDLLSEDWAALIALLESPAPPPPLSGLKAIHGGSATGRLFGGNLELLSRLPGTPLAASFHPGEPIILLLEEIGEWPYRIDRALTHLLNAGLLSDVAGVVIGDLVRCEAPGGAAAAQSPSALAVLAERLGPLSVPVAAGAPIGHGARNRAVPLGARVTLRAEVGSGDAALTFHDGAVS